MGRLVISRRLIWRIAFILYLTFNLVFCNSHQSGQTYPDTRTLSNTVLEIMDGPLSDIPIFIVNDETSQRNLDFDLMLSLSHHSITIAMLTDNEIENEMQDDILLHAPEFQKHAIVVLFVASYPEMLFAYQDLWYFEAIMIVSTNPNFDAKLVMETQMIQNCNKILLLEERTNPYNQSNIYLLSPKPFASDNESTVTLGSWDKDKFSTFSSIFPDRFVNFMNETLHVSTDMDDFPLVTKTDDDIREGMNLNILSAIGSWLNFSYTITDIAPDALWGELVNGTWNGLLGEIAYGEKNFTVNYFTITRERLEYFDCSVPYFREGFGFAVKIPPPVPAWLSLITPFTWQVSLVFIHCYQS